MDDEPIFGNTGHKVISMVLAVLTVLLLLSIAFLG